MRRLVTAGIFLSIAAASVAADPTDWTWLFPISGSPPAGNPHDRTAYKVRGSERSFSDMEIHNLRRAVDWFSAEHPTMPAIVAGNDKGNACGYCHLPDGNGRPENSALAGLPSDYIQRQIRAFADGSRRSALPGAVPVKMMVATAKDAPPHDVEMAARYFSKLRYVSHVRVVETSQLSFRAGRFVYVLAPGMRQQIGDRIIEVPVDPQGFERRDPRTKYVAYVPIGSVAKGRKIAARGASAGQPCASCHGAGLKGGLAPPLAGRSPTAIVRQLAAFQVGARSNPEAAPMRAIASQLDTKAMLAVAAYSATLQP